MVYYASQYEIHMVGEKNYITSFADWLTCAWDSFQLVNLIQYNPYKFTPNTNHNKINSDERKISSQKEKQKNCSSRKVCCHQQWWNDAEQIT